MRSISNKNNNSSVGAAKVIATFVILCICMQMCYGSAIPIWEFLTRNEKMSFLYSTFGQLVSVHCKATAATSAIPVNQCKHDLLTYGYEKLQTFTDSQLDQLDPYERNANVLIWSSIMRDHPSSILITTRKPLPTPSESSIVILTHQKTDENIDPTESKVHNKNPLFDGDFNNNKAKLAMDMALDIVYGDGNRMQEGAGNQKSHTETFLSGPLVFRVRPDGTPVEEDKYKPLPHDDDLEGYQFSSDTAVDNGTLKPTNNAATPSVTTANSHPKHHRKIAMISDLKQQHLASLALHRDLQPPREETRIRRQYHAGHPIAFPRPPLDGYYYTKGQA